jgi:hypothetical protein
MHHMDCIKLFKLKAGQCDEWLPQLVDASNVVLTTEQCSDFTIGPRYFLVDKLLKGEESDRELLSNEEAAKVVRNICKAKIFFYLRNVIRGRGATAEQRIFQALNDAIKKVTVDKETKTLLERLWPVGQEACTRHKLKERQRPSMPIKATSRSRLETGCTFPLDPSTTLVLLALEPFHPNPLLIFNTLAIPLLCSRWGLAPAHQSNPQLSICLSQLNPEKRTGHVPLVLDEVAPTVSSLARSASSCVYAIERHGATTGTALPAGAEMEGGRTAVDGVTPPAGPTGAAGEKQAATEANGAVPESGVGGMWVQTPRGALLPLAKAALFPLATPLPRQLPCPLPPCSTTLDTTGPLGSPRPPPPVHDLPESPRSKRMVLLWPFWIGCACTPAPWVASLG